MFLLLLIKYLRFQTIASVCHTLCTAHIVFTVLPRIDFCINCFQVGSIDTKKMWGYTRTKIMEWGRIINRTCIIAWKEEMSATCPFLNKKVKYPFMLMFWVHPKDWQKGKGYAGMNLIMQFEWYNCANFFEKFEMVQLCHFFAFALLFHATIPCFQT